jgi:hypothetical protein
MSTTATVGNGKHRIQFEDRTLSHGTPPPKLLGVLPLARWIPQDIHSMLDYGGGLIAAGGALSADEDDPVAKLASVVLGSSVIGVSAVTDYRLSAVKLLPIRVHEVLDYVWGASAIAAPFVLGYWKKSPRTALMHVVAGASTILGSLVTDYRAYKLRRRSKTAAR